jgi:hypothetical protein
LLRWVPPQAEEGLLNQNVLRMMPKSQPYLH